MGGVQAFFLPLLGRCSCRLLSCDPVLSLHQWKPPEFRNVGSPMRKSKNAGPDVRISEGIFFSFRQVVAIFQSSHSLWPQFVFRWFPDPNPFLGPRPWGGFRFRAVRCAKIFPRIRSLFICFCSFGVPFAFHPVKEDIRFCWGHFIPAKNIQEYQAVIHEKDLHKSVVEDAGGRKKKGGNTSRQLGCSVAPLLFRGS